MQSFASESGGRYFDLKVDAPQPKVTAQIADIFAEIVTELRGQYTIGFYPAAGAKPTGLVRVRTMNASYHIRNSAAQMVGPLETRNVDYGAYDDAMQVAQENERQGRLANAIEAAEKAASLDPSDTRVMRLLANLYGANKQFSKVVGALTKLRSLATLSGADHFSFGNALLEMADPAEAQTHFVQAISLTPDNPLAYLQLYSTDMKLEKPSDALSILDAYLRLFPKDQNHDLAAERAKRLRNQLKP